jgi:RNase P subunit RPR2
MPRPMRLTITCEDCGERHRLERLIYEPEMVYIVCHKCEGWLRVDITERHLGPRNPVKDPFAFLRR